MSVKENIDTVSMLQNAIESRDGKRYKLLAVGLAQAISEHRFDNTDGKLPPHRVLADALNVTTGTVGKAYNELEKLGIVVARVGAGTYVTTKEQIAKTDVHFKHVADDTIDYFDISRNINIPKAEQQIAASTLLDIAGNMETLANIDRYAPDKGAEKHRRAGASWLETDVFKPDWQNVICTNGGQHGLLCALLGLFKSGDTIATEQLTYPGLISLSKMLGIKLVPVAMDREGLIPESLDDVCNTHKIAGLYCMPSVQNPTNADMPNKRRKQVSDLCKKHNLLVLDDVSHVVSTNSNSKPLIEYSQDNTVMISSTGKALSSGLRVGYLYAPPQLQTRLSNSLRSTCWMATPLTQELAASWINSGKAAQIIENQLHEMRRRISLVEPLLAGLDYYTHPVSPHFWMDVPEPWRASEIESELKQHDVLVSTAEKFTVGRKYTPQFIRASVSTLTQNDARLIEAFKAIAGVLKDKTL